MGLSRAWPPFCPCWRENCSSVSSTKPFSVKCVSQREDLREPTSPMVAATGLGGVPALMLHKWPGQLGQQLAGKQTPPQQLMPGTSTLPAALSRLPRSPVGSSTWVGNGGLVLHARGPPREGPGLTSCPRYPEQSPRPCSNSPFRGLAPSAHSARPPSPVDTTSPASSFAPDIPLTSAGV